MQRNKFADIEEFTGRLVLRTHPALSMSDEEFFAFCQINRDLRIEKSAEGDWIVLPPTGIETGARNADITAPLREWEKRDGTGVRWRLASIGFLLPSGAARAPDASWTLRSRPAKLSPPERSGLAPLCPDLVIELRSPTDTLTTLQSKMAEYIANGARLGWLIDPARRAVHIYRPGAAAVVLAEPESISGAPELPDFTLQLAEI